MTGSSESEYKKRQHPRVKANVQYRPTKLIGRKHLAPNISLGGIRIFSNTHFKKGETVNIELSFPDGRRTIVLTKVAWVDSYPKDSDSVYEFGLKFIHVPTQSLDMLKLELDRASLDQ
jgi:hypothetical protein